jgi:hypothetical protein
LSGFGNVDFAAQNKSEGPRGFDEGQFILHLASALSPRVNFFGELSLTPRADAGTGSPVASGYNAEVERVIIRFDQSDHLKVSFGKFHTPVNWWNTAFHHGAWLQTTISRPEMTQFGGSFIPVHFVGALVEGSFPAAGWNINYQGGIGNGRGNVISRAGDAGDNNARPAYVFNLFTKPDRAFGLQVGGSLYLDRVSMTGPPEFAERIVAAHAIWQREDPDVIAEIPDVRPVVEAVFPFQAYRHRPDRSGLRSRASPGWLDPRRPVRHLDLRRHQERSATPAAVERSAEHQRVVSASLLHVLNAPCFEPRDD